MPTPNTAAPSTPAVATANPPEVQKPQVESAPTLGQLTPAARRKRYEELRKRMGESKLKVVGDPKLHYFWAHRTDDAQIIEFEGKGYWLVREEDPKGVLAGTTKPSISAAGLREDGTYIVGDVILLACALETYEFLLLNEDENMSQFKRAAKDDFVAEAESVGAPVFETVAPGKRK